MIVIRKMNEQLWVSINKTQQKKSAKGMVQIALKTKGRTSRRNRKHHHYHCDCGSQLGRIHSVWLNRIKINHRERFNIMR